MPHKVPISCLLMTEICRIEEKECFSPGFMRWRTECGEQFRQLLSKMTEVGILFEIDAVSC